MLSYLLRLREPDQYFIHFAKGQIFENAVIAELKKQALHECENVDFYFWRDNHGNEVDLMIDRGNRKYDVIEIKSSESAKPQFMKQLYWFEELSKMDCEKYVIYGGSQNIKTNKVDIRSLRSVFE